jgi:rhodanese-related sulfurtransferase
MTTSTISPSGLAQRHRSGQKLDLIDVRTPLEYQGMHVQFARNVPLDELNPAKVMQGHGSDEPLYVICQSGGRSRKAVEKFQQAGFSNVVDVEGGTQACEAAGLPLLRGKKAVSLERQVRIAAGSLVLTGVILGFLVHPVFFGLSAFVGAGLTFSGITDTCGMAMVLARMPWNKVRGAHCAT